MVEQNIWDSIRPADAVRLFALELSDGLVGHDFNALLRIVEESANPHEFLATCHDRAHTEYRVPGLVESVDLLERRRLSKDRERTVESSESFVRLGMIHLMLNRLEPKNNEPEFRYQMAA